MVWIRDHFKAHHPDLVEKYDGDLRAGAGQLDYLRSLDWMGPDFSLERRCEVGVEVGTDSAD